MSGGNDGTLASVPEVRRLLEVVLPEVRWSAAAAIAWYLNQQRRETAARASHRKRWLQEHPHIQPASQYEADEYAA